MDYGCWARYWNGLSGNSNVFALYARALDLLQKALDCIGVSDEGSFLWSSLHAVVDRADSCRAQSNLRIGC